MRKMFAGSVCAAVIAAWGLVALAQAGQPPVDPAQSNPAAAQKDTKAPAQAVTIVGCVQREADYRKAHNLGKGGAVGTGVGAGNEFVLINASTITATPADQPAATTGTVPGGTDAFELTGKNESQVEPFVGRRVEIVGTLKAADVKPGGATGGETAGKPPAGVDVVSKDLKLREIEVTSVKEATGTCPTTMK